jgi:hypothetical protein
MPKAIELLRPTIGGLINIEFVPEGEVLAALVDPNQLTTAGLNLALNARDAMPNGGSLVFRTGNIELRKSLRRSCGRKIRNDLDRRYRPRHRRA